ncbi:MAG: sensor histidine kinase [Flavobacteriales bacterium]
MENWDIEKSSLIYVVIGSIILFGLLIGFMALYTKLYIKRIKEEQSEKLDLKLFHEKELLTQSLEIQERERERIAGELHDHLVGQIRVAQLVSENPEVKSKLKSVIGDARRLSHDLLPPFLEKENIEQLISDYIYPFRKLYKIKLHFDVRTNISFDTKEKLHLFRIFQEVFMNIDKHAQTESIDVWVRKTDSSFCLIVKDCGIGFKEISSHLGMKNIAIRARQIGAAYQLKSKPKRGTTFILKIENYGYH